MKLKYLITILILSTPLSFQCMGQYFEQEEKKQSSEIDQKENVQRALKKIVYNYNKYEKGKPLSFDILNNNFNMVFESQDRKHRELFLEKLEKLITDLRFIEKITKSLYGYKKAASSQKENFERTPNKSPKPIYLFYNIYIPKFIRPYAVLFKILTKDNKSIRYPTSQLSDPQYILLKAFDFQAAEISIILKGETKILSKSTFEDPNFSGYIFWPLSSLTDNFSPKKLKKLIKSELIIRNDKPRFNYPE